MPNNVYANNSILENTFIKVEKKMCCSKKEGNKDKKCDGKCCTSRCNCIPAPLSFFINSDIPLKNNTNSITSMNWVKFPYYSPTVSDGFYSIWLLPKIN